MVVRHSFYKLRCLISFLFFFCLVVDPTNYIFHMKEFLFISFCLFNLKHISGRYIVIPVVCLFFVLQSFIFSPSFLYNKDFDYSFALLYVKSFLFLFLLLYIDVKDIKLIDYFVVCVAIMSIIELVICFFYFFYPNIASIIYSYVYGVEGSNFPIKLMGMRIFLNGRIKLFSVFYTTSPLIVIIEPFIVYVYLVRRRLRHLFLSCLLFFALYVSGTRANILLGFLGVSVAFLVFLYYRKKYTTFILLCLLTLFFFVIVGAVLITDQSDLSLSTKSMHIQSIVKLFEKDITKYLFTGNAPGSLFYTIGWNKLTTNVEVVYLDLIRMFGFFPFCIIFLYIVYPVFLIWCNRRNSRYVNILFICGYIFYLIIGGTNPLIIGSTGFLAIFLAYYMSEIKIEI